MSPENYYSCEILVILMVPSYAVMIWNDGGDEIETDFVIHR